MSIDKANDNQIKSMTFGDTKVEGLSFGIKCPECHSSNDVNVTDISGKQLVECMGNYDDGSGCCETFVVCWEMNTTATVHTLEPKL